MWPKAGSGCCKLPLQTTEEDERDIRKATVSLAAAKEMSVDAAVAAFDQNWKVFLTLKENQEQCFGFFFFVGRNTEPCGD